MNTKLTLKPPTTTHHHHHHPPKTFRRALGIAGGQNLVFRLQVLTLLVDHPLPLGSKCLNQIFFGLECFLRVCNGYFSKTQSLPKLNTFDLSLFIYKICISSFKLNLCSVTSVTRLAVKDLVSTLSMNSDLFLKLILRKFWSWTWS